MQRDPQAAPHRAQFEYVSDARYHAPQGHVVRIGRGVKSKRALLAIYAESLQFPAYFGWNWDALEECLHDLSWLDSSPTRSGVTIVHEAIPLRNRSADRRVYLELLSALVDRPPASDHAVAIVFPASAQAKIDLCLS